MSKLILIAALLLVGCAFSRTMGATFTGRDIKTPQGAGDGTLQYNSTTSWGFGCKR